jgi:hypothetical protein
MILVISIVVAMFTAPINLLVDYLFVNILSAPTADALKVKLLHSNAIKRVGEVGTKIRRLSVNAARRASTTLQDAAGQISNTRRGKRISLIQFDEKNETRMIPDDTIRAQRLATASITQILHTIQDVQGNYEENRNALLLTSTSKSLVSTRNRSDIESFRNQSKVITSPNGWTSNSDVDDKYVRLLTEIGAQRKRLKLSEQENFDRKWGVDLTREEYGNGILQNFKECLGLKPADNKLKLLLLDVQQLTEAKYEKLKFATDSHTGLELLHLFILDILGRNTPAALIFQRKADTEYDFAFHV